MSNEQVVNVPLTGGINQDDDVLAVSPPDMLELKNVSVVKRGALDRRFGFEAMVMEADGRLVPIDAYPSGNTVAATYQIIEAGRPIVVGNKVVFLAYMSVPPTNPALYYFVRYDPYTNSYAWQSIGTTPITDVFDTSNIHTDGIDTVWTREKSKIYVYTVSSNTISDFTAGTALEGWASAIGTPIINGYMYAIDNVGSIGMGRMYKTDLASQTTTTVGTDKKDTKKLLGHIVRGGQTRLLTVHLNNALWTDAYGNNSLVELSIVDRSVQYSFGPIPTGYLLGPNADDRNLEDRSVWVQSSSRAYLTLNGYAYMIDYSLPTPALVDITATLAAIPGFVTGAGFPITTANWGNVAGREIGGGLSVTYSSADNIVWFASCPVSGSTFPTVAVGLNGDTGAVVEQINYTPGLSIMGIAGSPASFRFGTGRIQTSPTAAITRTDIWGPQYLVADNGSNTWTDLYQWTQDQEELLSGYRGLTGEIEALSEHTSAAGSNLVTISGGEFFEHVGVDAANATKDRNWRYVNDVPKYVGTLVSVASTGGPIIEIESMLFDNDTKRATVWVTGTRNGAELVSERSLLDQSAGDHNSVYYSVQRVENDSYLVPPTRVFYGDGTPVTSAINLKLAFVNPGAGSGTNAASTVVLAWYNKAAVQIEYALMDADSGELRTVYSFARTHAALGFVSCHRNFDIVGIPDANAAPTAILVTCPEETLAPSPGPGVFNPAPLPAVVVTFNYTTGAASTRATVSNILSSVQSIPVGAGWRIVANRGVVLENEPTYIQTSSSTWTVSVAVSLRALAVSYDGSGNPGVADCQMLLGTLDATFTDGFPIDTYTLAARGYKAIPNIGFQTQDYLDVAFNGLGLNGPTYPSKSVDYSQGETFWISSDHPTYPSTQTALDPTSEVAVAVGLSSVPASVQQYYGSVYQDFNPTVGGNLRGKLSGLNPQPWSGQGGLYPRGVLYEKAPRPVRQYPNDQKIPWITAALPDPTRQVNLLEFSSGGGTGFNAGTHTCVLRYNDGVQDFDIATVGVVVNTNGVIIASAIYDSLPGYPNAPFGPTPPFNFATRYLETAGANTLSLVSPTLGAGTLTGLRAWNIMAGVNTGYNGAVIPEYFDVPDTTTPVPQGQSAFIFAGQMEDCVHRWSVAHRRQTSGLADITLALSSTVASKFSNPNGANEFAAVNPVGYNNFCEFYGTAIATGMAAYESLVPVSGGTTSVLKCALGGPWRLTGSLVRAGADQFDASSNQYYCAVTPSGDVNQVSTFLVRVTNGSAALTVPNAAGSEAIGSFPTPEKVTYTNNLGLFVDAANAMRVTAAPFNVPTLMRARNSASPNNTNLSMGLLRQGSSKGSQECLAIKYESDGKAWRKMLPFDDYTFVNGGVLSVFDGVNCGEFGHMVWPQRDLTSIAWSDGGARPANLTTIGSRFFQIFPRSGSLEYPLAAVTRPFFLQEAGLQSFNDAASISGVDGYAPATNPWGYLQTSWGGSGAQNYEYAAIDIRTPQASSPNADGLQHFYGRYHATSTYWNSSGDPIYLIGQNAFDRAYFLWAPRAALGWDNANTSTYNPQDTAGNFMMSFCYEYADGTGRMVKSAPSLSAVYTICAEIQQGKITKTSDGQSQTPKTVSLFKWGFFAPRLELTNRKIRSEADARRVVIQPYTTAEPYSTVLYRMPWSNFENPVGDFVINRNVTRGVVPRATEPWNGFQSNSPVGLVVRNMGQRGYRNQDKWFNAVFDGPQGEYNGILSQPYLYTAGGVLDNVAPPGCKSMCIHQNRLVIGGADDPTVVWFSKQLSPTDAPGFNDLLTISIEQGGAVTGLASMNSNLIVFKRNTIFVIAGTMPDDTGNANGLAEPVQLQSGIGCTDHRSIIETPVGVFFRSERGLELLTPSLQVVAIGDKVVDSLNAYKYVPSCVHNAKAEEIYFIGHEQAPTHETTSSYFKCLVYSYRGQSWYEWVLAPLGDGYAFMTSMAGVPYIATKTAAPNSNLKLTTVYKLTEKYVDKLPNLTPSPTPSYALSYPGISFSLAPIAMNQVQGFQRLKRIRLNGLAFISVDSSAPTVSFAATPDGVSVGFSTWTPAQLLETLQGTGLLGLEMHQPYQKGQLISFAFQETTNTPHENSNLRLSNIAMVVGLKTGLNKRTTEQAKH